MSDEIIMSLLSKRLADGEAKGESGFILDGFPRTIKQAVSIDTLLTSLYLLPYVLVVGFDVSGDLVTPTSFHNSSAIKMCLTSVWSGNIGRGNWHWLGSQSEDPRGSTACEMPW